MPDAIIEVVMELMGLICKYSLATLGSQRLIQEFSRQFGHGCQINPSEFKELFQGACKRLKNRGFLPDKSQFLKGSTFDKKLVETELVNHIYTLQLTDTKHSVDKIKILLSLTEQN